MFTHATAADFYADLGAAWLHHQTVRLHQTYLQFGRHHRVDVEGLVERIARQARLLEREVNQ